MSVLVVSLRWLSQAKVIKMTAGCTNCNLMNGFALVPVGVSIAIFIPDVLNAREAFVGLGCYLRVLHVKRMVIRLFALLNNRVYSFGDIKWMVCVLKSVLVTVEI